MISIVIPVFNEQKVFEELYERLNKAMASLDVQYECVFVNDGSLDESLNKLLSIREKDNRVKVINFSRNFGHQISISAGLNYARGDAVIVMDADLQDPPEMIPQFIAQWRNGYDVVYAVRKERKGESLIKKFCYKIYYHLLKRLTDVEVPLYAGDFRLLSRRVVDHIASMQEKRRYIRGLASWVGFKQIGIEYVRPAREQGETKYSFKKLTALAWEGITSLSVKPLQIATYSGILFSFVAFFYLLRVLYIRLFTDSFIPGWTSLMAMILFLGGIQLFCIGIIGEYIGRMAEEVRNRPAYIIEKIYD